MLKKNVIKTYLIFTGSSVRSQYCPPYTNIYNDQVCRVLLVEFPGNEPDLWTVWSVSLLDVPSEQQPPPHQADIF